MDAPHSEEPPTIRQKTDEGITSTHFGSFDFMNSVSRFPAGPNHNFHEVTSHLYSYFDFSFSLNLIFLPLFSSVYS